MGVKTEWVRYGASREHSGYFAIPERAQPPLPAVVVLQEAWGVSEHIEDVTRRYALAGYAALAPDLYARDNVRPQQLTRERLAESLAFLHSLPPADARDPNARAAALALREPPERERISETIKTAFAAANKLDPLVPQLLAATSYLREVRPETRGQQLASVGFCMGGGLSALLACHDPRLAAAAIYYGKSPSAELAQRIECPVIGFYGGTDKPFTDQVPAFAEAMARAAKRFEPHVYEGVGHAFFNDTRPSYDVRAARDAFARTLELFRKTLV